MQYWFRLQVNMTVVSMLNKKVNAKSIMGLMSLGLSAGEEVVVSIDGDDETNAMDEIEKYLSAAQA